MDLDTVAPSTTLRRRAQDAYEASRLEHAAEAERRAAAESERMVATAAAAINQLFGPASLERVVEPRTIDGRDAVVAHVAGVALVISPHFPRAPRGLVACPLCARPDCRTVGTVNSLERLGQLVTDPATLELDPHVTTDGADTCNGLEWARIIDPPEPWVTRFGTTSERVAEICNELADGGYDPTVVAGSMGGWLVLGQRRRNDGPSDPF